MDLLGGYGSASGSDSEFHETAPVNLSHKRIKINVAPDVSLEDPSLSKRIITSITDKSVAVNIPYDDMVKPVMGPNNPFRTRAPNQNILTGHVEEQAISEHDFRTQERTFRSFGYARDPSVLTYSAQGQVGGGLDGSGFVGDTAKAIQFEGATIYDSKAKQNKNLAKRKTRGDSSVLEGENAYKGPWAGYEGERIGELAGPDEEEIPVQTTPVGEDTSNEPTTGTETSIFHGKSEYDYQGRTYIHIPQDLDINLLGEPGEQDCFLPKKHIHTWTGHTKGVSAIRFFPRSGHLLLSAGMDSKVKIWDVYHERQCLRTFIGHSKAVRDITFSNDGRRFLTASYDRFVKLWDTETGQCIRSFTTKKIPYCVKFNPDEDKQHIFLAGCSDKKIVQFDINTGEITQEYDQHLGAVNSITFVDENRRFVTTSDDKTLRAWEFDIPVVIKYIAEPYMHSMPSVSLHPNKKWLACQSLDNQIVVYGAKDRFRLNGKKRFTGHVIAGYACQPNFSADGRFIMSGDAEGKLWFWDWKTTKVLKRFKAHDSVLIGCEWHPQETSKVATCSWDGTIKYWD
ncbi:WD40 repeat-like protein [Basidiobolus meristosporus CBS 931.73]|uniref:Pre-mRNA-processing factor 17 n=1 Tax=Basidiobolus meristosporus CBS 931.73 TaxID=1314790 RepID=A0A1Y1Y0D2_9FUNG|nr:WD40 repeat-like protein [Basidiobolus meristosporus CBS 931.73]|eukprot:ORX91457.1 WD40 repeat-like protein [Basidiobolus meristosporus CBS 931.73]